ncbi:MAG: hypothetical protein Fur0039_08680 [Rhodocyclaceae bacterium]
MKRKIVSGLALLAASQSALANIDIQFDYGYDSTGFFSSHAGSMSALEAAAGVFESRFADSLTAIVSGGGNQFTTSFFDPAAPGASVSLPDQTIAADVVRVYVGGASLGGGTLGLGGPGAWTCSGFGSFCDDAGSRGQGVTSGAGAVDFGPWGGSISFDSATSWHFGLTTAGLTGSQADFFSVAVHELGHVLGFGTSDAFDARISGANFVGPSAGTVALSGDLGHWAEGTTSFVGGLSQEAAMDPTLFFGSRKEFTDLDFAGMRDIGWDVTPVPEPGTWTMLLAGLGLVGFAVRRRAS